MNPSSKYLIDANVFIQAKNFHYRFGFCQAFWEWLIDAHEAGIVFSIDKVRKELNNFKKDDAVKSWIKTLPESFFIADITDGAVRKEYSSIMQWIASDTHYLPQAKAEFANIDETDAFLIATALAHNCMIVTHETRSPAQKIESSYQTRQTNFLLKLFLYRTCSANMLTATLLLRYNRLS